MGREKQSQDNLNGTDYLTRLLRSETKRFHGRRIGLEIERIGFWPDGMALRYRAGNECGQNSRPGAERLLSELARKNGWPPINSPSGDPIGLTTPLGKVSLEPGSQLEFSTDASSSLHSVMEKAREFEAAVEKITSGWGLRWPGIGVNPANRVDEIDVIPAPRYEVMTEYLARRGNLATSMMRLTSSVQINLDYTSEEEGIEMLRTALAAAPVSYALFASSPIFEGKPTGYLSYRGAIWRETDPDRAGCFPEAFQDGFDFSDYAGLVWSRPLMYAQKINGEVIAAKGTTLLEIAKGALPDVEPDEANQMSAVRQLFFEARLKPGYVEVRSVDGQNPGYRYAAAAFWMGVLYSKDARRLALDRLGELTPKQRDNLLVLATQVGLKASLGGVKLKDIAGELLHESRCSLKDRGFGEEKFLEPLEENFKRGICPADNILARFSRKTSREDYFLC